MEDDLIDRGKIEQFNTTIISLTIENSPDLNIKHYIHELPPYITKMIKNKRKMHRDYLRDPNVEAKTQLNNYNKNVQALIR